MYPSIAHEIGHVLALSHTFENNFELGTNYSEYENYKNALAEYEKALPVAEAEIIVVKQNLDNELKKTIINREREIYKEYIKNHSINIIDYKSLIPTFKRIIESHEWFRDHLNNGFCYCFETGETDNIMDYKLNKQNQFEFFFTFSQWQWITMQKDLVQFHNK